MLASLLRANVRAPEQNWGDLNAQIASLGGRRAQVPRDDRTVRRRRLVARASASLLDYAAAQAREVVRGIPNGEYFFCDYADEDSDNGYPCRIAITLKVADEDLVLDFTGSDPQLQSSLNVPTGGLASGTFCRQSALSMFSTL